MTQNVQKSFKQKFHHLNLAQPMFKNNDVIKNKCGLPKTFSQQNIPKLILGKAIEFQKGLMKIKKIGRQKIEKRGLLLDPSSP